MSHLFVDTFSTLAVVENLGCKMTCKPFMTVLAHTYLRDNEYACSQNLCESNKYKFIHNNCAHIIK